MGRCWRRSVDVNDWYGGQNQKFTTGRNRGQKNSAKIRFCPDSLVTVVIGDDRELEEKVETIALTQTLF
jgi:hypothetical protein